MNDIDNILNKYIESNKSPSIQYSIFTQDNIIYRFCSGYADVLALKKVNQNTTYNSFSVTKTFTALAILQLAEKGKLKIDDPIIKFIPGFIYSTDISIRQLLTHSSGIPNPIPISWIHLMKEHRTFDRNGFFKQVFAKHNKTKSLPNEKYAYSNLGYVLLGQIIENVSGFIYEDYIRKNILQPLGLSSKELDFEIFNTDLHAKGYQKKFSFMNSILGFYMDKEKYMDKAEGRWKPFKNLYVNGTSYGGLVGSLEGFEKYIQELLSSKCQLLSNEYKDMLFMENFTYSMQATEMCLSWFRGQLYGQEYLTHAGGGGGYYCEIRMYPRLSLGSVIMFNRSGMTDERFLDKVDKYYIR